MEAWLKSGRESGPSVELAAAAEAVAAPPAGGNRWPCGPLHGVEERRDRGVEVSGEERAAGGGAGKREEERGRELSSRLSIELCVGGCLYNNIKSSYNMIASFSY